jgi:hypothetical protein
LELDDECTVGGLQRKIQEQLKIPLSKQILSKDKRLVRMRGGGAVTAASSRYTRNGFYRLCAVPIVPRGKSRVGLTVRWRAQLVSKDPESFEDLQDATYTLTSLGIRHGEMVGRGPKGVTAADATCVTDLHNSHAQHSWKKLLPGRVCECV